MILNSILFSLGDPKDNLYIQMFVLLYFSFIKTRCFGPVTDIYYLTCDKETADYIKETFPLVQYVRYVIVPKPASVYEGMMMKYKLPFLVDVKDETVMYIDTDMFFVKKFKVDCPLDTLLVYPEGPGSNESYCGDMILKSSVGFTAGFFIYRWGDKVKEVFTKILDDIGFIPKKYYTLDQPYFNKHLESAQYCVLDERLISFNGNNNKDCAALINCAGIPGNGLFHWNKMLQLFLYYM